MQFGVRVPRERAGAPVIRRERRAYYWRTAAIGVCCTAAAVLVQGYGPWWLSRIILLLELAADLGCFWVARRKIAAVKNADNWFAGLRQRIVTDTSWRADPPRFPVRWLIPALAVIAATAAVGALRYPGLPAHIVTGSGHRVPKVCHQRLGGGRPAVRHGLVERADADHLPLPAGHRGGPPAASTLRYRRFLAAYDPGPADADRAGRHQPAAGRPADWQVYRLPGIGRALPALRRAGMLLLAAVALRTGQGGSRMNGNVRGLARRPGPTGTTTGSGRPPALPQPGRSRPVGARFGAGWTLNVGNPAAWLIIAGIVAVPAGLAVIGAAAGM